MRATILSDVALLVLGFGVMPADGQAPPSPTDARVLAASRILGQLAGGDYDSVAAAVDPQVPAGTFSATSLERIWSELTTRLGTFQGAQPVRLLSDRGYQVVDFDAAFATAGRVRLRVVLDAERRLTGFWQSPAEPAPYDAPRYVDPAAFTEREVELGEEPWTLPGTLTVSKRAGPLPGVVLLHGSGPNDRDESLGPNRPFRDLAWGLATAGVVVLRYEKRTRRYGSRLNPATIDLEEEVLADAHAALALLRAQPEVDAGRTVVLGHSLGAFLAPGLAEHDSALAGAILLAAPARPQAEVVAGQLDHVFGLRPAASPQEEAERAALRAQIDSLRHGLLPDDAMVLGATVRYWKELDAQHPTEAALRSHVALLILQGERDYQVTMADFALWRTALEKRPGTTLHSFPGLDHLFMPGTDPSSPEEYLAGARHVDPTVIAALAAWIEQLPRPASEPHGPLE